MFLLNLLMRSSQYIIINYFLSASARFKVLHELNIYIMFDVINKPYLFHFIIFVYLKKSIVYACTWHII